MDQLCRVCLTSIIELNSTNLLTSPASSPDQLNLLEMLTTICNPIFSTSQPDDDESGPLLPLEVCPECTGKILSAYELFQLCVESDRKLREMLLEQNKPIDLVEVHYTAEDELEPVEMLEVKTEKDCEICHRALKSSKSLKRHMAKIHQVEALTCGDCQEAFYSAKSLEEHKLLHANNSNNDLKDHQQQAHPSEPTFLCTTCGKSFNNRSNLRQHSVRHTDQKRFACGECPARFHSKGSLKRHVLVHTKERPFGCEVCGARFTVSYSLAKHRQIHSDEERPFGCSVCKLRFRNKHHLTRHQRVHSGEKPYKCKLCERAFAQSNDLVKHSRTQHFGENLYPCSRCEASFRLLAELKDHYRVHFQGEEEQISEEVCFTSVSMIERRLERVEKLREDQGSRRDRGERSVKLEQVVATSVDIGDIPTMVKME